MKFETFMELSEEAQLEMLGGILGCEWCDHVNGIYIARDHGILVFIKDGNLIRLYEDYEIFRSNLSDGKTVEYERDIVNLIVAYEEFKLLDERLNQLAKIFIKNFRVKYEFR